MAENEDKDLQTTGKNDTKMEDGEVDHPIPRITQSGDEDQLDNDHIDEVTEHPESSKAEQTKFVKQLDSLLKLVDD